VALWQRRAQFAERLDGVDAYARTRADADAASTERRLSVCVCCAGTQSGITIAKTRALRTAGSFGAWGAMFATSEFFILMAR
jgi:hypothetical protein